MVRMRMGEGRLAGVFVVVMNSRRVGMLMGVIIALASVLNQRFILAGASYNCQGQASRGEDYQLHHCVSV